MDLMGVRINTIIHEQIAIRCDACSEIIDGTPWRVNILDIVAPESSAPSTDEAVINPGPFQFHPDPSHVRAWMARRGWFFCRKGDVREQMRPIHLPGDRLGVCDGIHRDAHEFVPA